jgi:TrmH family RNA methyltransferase
LVIAEALASSVQVMELFVADDAPSAADLKTVAEAQGIPVWTVSDQVINALSETRTPQGVVAVASAPSASAGAVPEAADLVVILAGVGDPGNAGTLVRSAAAAGASAVVFTSGAVDPLGPKALRSSAGAMFRVPIVRGVALDDVVEHLRSMRVRIVGADAHATVTCDRADLSGPIAFVLGNEAWGISSEWRHLLDDTVAVPMPGAVDSLNVGIAGSILLYEAVRQRRLRSTAEPLSFPS